MIPNESHSDRHRWMALAVLCVAEFMLVLDITAVNVALPTIGRDLGAGLDVVAWVITAYIVAFGGLMLLGGRVADVIGRRRLLIVGIVVFAVSSALCGLAPDIGWLIAGRAVQGVGAAMISPAALASIPAMFSASDRARALAVWAGVGATGFAAGLILSGALTSGPGWRWIFLINVPVSIVVIAGLRSLVPDLPGARARVDVLGGVLLTVFAAALVYGLGGLSAASAWTVGPFVLAAGSLALFLRYERHHPAPLIPTRILRSRPVLTGLTLMLMASGTMVSVFFLGSLSLQLADGLGPLQTGIAFLPAAVATLLSAHLAGHLLSQVSVRLVAGTAFAVAGVGAIVLIAADGAGSVWSTVAGLGLVCLGLGPAFVVATTSALHGVDQSEAGIVSGAVNTGHEIGGAFGIAVITAVAGGSTATIGLDSSAAGYIAVAIGAGLSAILALALAPAAKADASLVSH